MTCRSLILLNHCLSGVTCRSWWILGNFELYMHVKKNFVSVLIGSLLLMIIMESLAQSFVYQLCLHCPGYREHQSGLCLGYQRIGGRALPLRRGRSLGVCSATLGGAG